jgi:hypothetical protein
MGSHCRTTRRSSAPSTHWRHRWGSSLRSPTPAPSAIFSSESVFFLPGAVEISAVRRIQELERIPSGRTIACRFMVRGHWRRPNASWKDQRIRWIKPYWKGPDIAAVIERAYKLKPPSAGPAT